MSPACSGATCAHAGRLDPRQGYRCYIQGPLTGSEQNEHGQVSEMAAASQEERRSCGRTEVTAGNGVVSGMGLVRRDGDWRG